MESWMPSLCCWRRDRNRGADRCQWICLNSRSSHSSQDRWETSKIIEMCLLLYCYVIFTFFWPLSPFSVRLLSWKGWTPLEKSLLQPSYTRYHSWSFYLDIFAILVTIFDCKAVWICKCSVQKSKNNWEFNINVKTIWNVCLLSIKQFGGFIQGISLPFYSPVEVKQEVDEGIQEHLSNALPILQNVILSFSVFINFPLS